jgi:ribosome biogenesis protein SSF1/2
VPRRLETLATSVFQSLFPALDPARVALSGLKRVVLADRGTSTTSTSSTPSSGEFVVALRHYLVVTRPAGLSTAVRRLARARRPTSAVPKTPNLGAYADAAEYVLAAAAGSESEAETENEAEEVEIGRRARVKATSKFVAHRRAAAKANTLEGETSAGAAGDQPSQLADSSDENGPAHIEKELPEARVERTAVRLVELGPRLDLRLIKVEDGCCEGNLLWEQTK